MFLEGNKRAQDNQIFDKTLIEDIRLQNDLTDEQVEKLKNLHLDAFEANHGRQERQEVEKKAIYLYYTNEKRIRHNMQKLSMESSADRPVAVMPAHGYGALTGKPLSRHFDSQSPTSAMLCVGAKVAIDGRNFIPLWGLHNSACGTVVEIIFGEGNSPNNGDLPLYIVVDFPLYCGPPWDLDNPSHVPIPPIKYGCKYTNASKTCCKRTIIPLCLAWARTIHKFQGMSAGPVDDGKIPNMFDCIVCDPDKREVERSALGLFYTSISRGTTLGSTTGLGSAVFFCGSDFNEDRIRNIGRRNHTNEEYIRVKKRNTWVKYLMSKKTTSSLSKKKIRQVLAWSESHKSSFAFLWNRIEDFVEHETGNCKCHVPKRAFVVTPSPTASKRKRKSQM
jgi:hypothetical protein